MSCLCLPGSPGGWLHGAWTNSSSRCLSQPGAGGVGGKCAPHQTRERGPWREGKTLPSNSDGPLPASPVLALGGQAGPQWALQLEGALKTLFLWREEVRGCGRDEAHVWASGPKPKCAWCPPCSQGSAKLRPSGHPNWRGDKSLGEWVRDPGQRWQWSPAVRGCCLLACLALGRWWPWDHVSYGQWEEGLWPNAANSSALMQSFPEHSSLAQVGVVTNSTHLVGHPKGPLGLGAHHSLGCLLGRGKVSVLSLGLSLEVPAAARAQLDPPPKPSQ